MTGPTLVRLDPATPPEAAALVREAARDGVRLAFVGGGTHAVPYAGKADGILSTRAMRAIVEYAPQDQTVTVEAGMTIAELARVLGANDQRLVLDVAEPERATLGGSIAANAFGARRLRYGSLKDLILGVTMVRADGTPARAGGKVVKNVAGFDLAKLIVGSYGALALITSATLRVHPAPERTRALRVSALSALEVWEFVLATRARQLEPASIVAIRRAGSLVYAVDVVLEGFPAGVDAQVESLQTLARVAGSRVEEIEPQLAFDADRAVRGGGTVRVRCTARPSECARSDAAVTTPLLEGLDGASADLYPSLGVTFVAGTPRDATALRDALVAARAELEQRAGALVVEALPGDLLAGLALDTWGTPPASFALMRQLKTRFDPLGRFNPGSFVGGL